MTSEPLEHLVASVEEIKKLAEASARLLGTQSEQILGVVDVYMIHIETRVSEIRAEIQRKIDSDEQPD